MSCGCGGIIEERPTQSHILFILKEQDRLHSGQEVDQVITAEFPPDPDTFPDGPQREKVRLLELLIVIHMAQYCTEFRRQQGSQCEKGYPKDYSEVTHLDDNAFYPIYKWRPSRKWDGQWRLKTKSLTTAR